MIFLHGCHAFMCVPHLYCLALFVITVLIPQKPIQYNRHLPHRTLCQAATDVNGEQLVSAVLVCCGRAGHLRKNTIPWIYPADPHLVCQMGSMCQFNHWLALGERTRAKKDELYCSCRHIVCGQYVADIICYVLPTNYLPTLNNVAMSLFFYNIVPIGSRVSFFFLLCLKTAHTHTY